MTDIHPHWQEEEETPVAVRVKTHENEPKTLSRRPAAIFGMIAVLVIGFFLFEGTNVLRGQVASGPTVLIAEGIILPESIEVEHGQTITFINDREALVTISSSTLCSDTGFCLETRPLERGEAATFSITPDMQSGTYEYIVSDGTSQTAVVEIVTDTAEDFVDFASLFNAEPPAQMQGNDTVEPKQPLAVPEPTSPEPVQQYVPSNAIPRNPYTVDSGYQDFADPDPTPAQVAFTQTGGPMRQPETGASTNIVLVLSVGILWLMTKRILAKDVTILPQ